MNISGESGIETSLTDHAHSDGEHHVADDEGERSRFFLADFSCPKCGGVMMDGFVEGESFTPDGALVDQVIVNEHEGMKKFERGGDPREWSGDQRILREIGQDSVC